MSFIVGGVRQDMKVQTERIMSEMRLLEKTYKGNTRMFRNLMKNMGLIPDDLKKELKGNLLDIKSGEEKLIEAIHAHITVLERVASEL